MAQHANSEEMFREMKFSSDREAEKGPWHMFMVCWEMPCSRGGAEARRPASPSCPIVNMRAKALHACEVGAGEMHGQCAQAAGSSGPVVGASAMKA